MRKLHFDLACITDFAIGIFPRIGENMQPSSSSSTNGKEANNLSVFSLAQSRAMKEMLESMNLGAAGSTNGKSEPAAGSLAPEEAEPMRPTVDSDSRSLTRET